MQHSKRQAFSLVELLIVVAIIGVLIGLLLPAVEAARNAVAKAECASNMRQQGLALHGYHDVYGCFPPPRINPTCGAHSSNPGPADFYTGQFGTYRIQNHSAFTLMLPFLEQDDLYKKYDMRVDNGFSQASNSNWGHLATGGLPAAAVNQARAGNREVVSTYIKQYHCPADGEPEVDDGGRRSNYVFNIHDEMWSYYGIVLPPDDDTRDFYLLVFRDHVLPPEGMFRDNHCYRISDMHDGLQTTIAIGEIKQENFSGAVWQKYLPHWGGGGGDNSGSTTPRATAGFASSINNTPGGVPPHCLNVNFPRGSWPVMGGDPSHYSYYLQEAGGFGSWHPNGANFLMGDGSVQYLRNNIPYPVFSALTTRNGVHHEEPMLDLEGSY